MLKLYQDLEKKVKGTPNALRYIQYQMAMLAVDRAKDDPSVDAVAALNNFRTANSGGWEIMPATKALADLLEAKGDPAGARAAYEELAANPDAPENVQLAANLQVARLLSRDNKNADAEQKLKAVAAGLKADDPQRTYVQVSLAQTQVAQGNIKEAEAPLKAAVAGAGDDHLKALAYNALGDYYLQNKQPDEAFWQYLRVDAVYNQDREEHARRSTIYGSCSRRCGPISLGRTKAYKGWRTKPSRGRTIRRDAERGGRDEKGTVMAVLALRTRRWVPYNSPLPHEAMGP